MPAADDGLGRALTKGELTEAEYALERALSLFRPERARALYGDLETAGPRDATMILRDLAVRLDRLGPRKRALAQRVLARPTSRKDAITRYRVPARRVCGAHICVWWVTRTVHAPRLVDRNRNGLPDWVDRTRAVLRLVWTREVGTFRYRPPRSDRTSRNHGPNGKIDVYIADVGRNGLYGYCTSDDPARARRRAVSSYCVLDDDFPRRQFRNGATGLNALRVTAAHEFFHAIQYAYDWLEDLWLMEGTATWIEDEIFDRVNDNLQYLRTSPLSARFFYLPLDYYDPDPSEFHANFKYGAWVFWRYLSERFGRDVVRAVWRRADSRAGAPNEYSLKAVVSALASRGQDFATVFSDFGAGNVFPAGTYSEGVAYSTPRPTRVFAVTSEGVARTRVPMFHLSNDYYAFVPSGVAPTATLTVALELTDREAAMRASALVQFPTETVRVPAAFDPALGRWTISVANFGSAQRAVLVLTNGSTRYACWKRSVFSCRGRPLDDVDFHFEAAVS